MTATPVKKKRFEGLIQFQDPLRQALVCLQAALAERFVTGAQSEYLKLRDTPLTSHFLMTSNGSEVGDLVSGLEARHILMRVEQLEKCTPTWQAPDTDAKISAWIDSRDALSTQYFFQVLAGATTARADFDLGLIHSWGTSVHGQASPSPQLLQQPWLNLERTQLIKSFLADASPLFTNIDNQNLATDGCSVAFIIEGPTALSLAELSNQALKQLVKPHYHLVAVNYISGPKPRLQCVYLTPMRLPLKDLQSSALKGFLLIHDIKETAKSDKTVLAS